ncbi:hypothetical protein DVH24_005331 [Malus domestica]|uniref:WAT1-related protein n=1 Tax=Malus domestica TaxID=3750 RepID=A0A498KIM8_MALDO|nr:hypothetical protein DVH24_005331 [Malus domestica]
MNCWGKWKFIILMLIINLALAIVNILLKKTLDGGLGGLIIVTYRQSISAVFLTPIAFFWERKSRTKLTSRILCHLFISALIGLEKVNIKNKGGIAKVLGALICIGGAVSLILYKGMPLTNQHSESTLQMQNHANTTTFSSAKKSDRWAIGSVLLASGCLLWSSWFLIQAKIGKSYPFHYSSTAILSFFGAIQSAILCFITQRHIVMSMWILKGKLEILSIGVVGSGLCYVGMSWCVKQKGALFTAAFTPATQIFVAMLEFSFLHEQIYLRSVVGSVIVITGMYILLWGKSKDQKEMVIKHTQATDQDQESGPMPQGMPLDVNK